MAAPALASFGAFAAWLEHYCRREFKVQEDSKIHDVLPDVFSLFAVLAALELHAESSFPPDLLDVIVTCGDLYYFACVKSS